MAQVLDASGAPLTDPDAVLARLGVVLATVPLPEGTAAQALAGAAAAGDVDAVTALVDVPDEVLAQVPAVVATPRGVLVVDPGDPAGAGDREVFGAWHVNDAHELHLILSGEGSFWFADADGVAAQVVLGPGDVIGITGTEHRYVAGTAQAFLVRHSAPADMTPTPTGRPA
ncbi:MAG: hypothetical protein R2737_11820 [Candidatus Nanopelagicales bacterium]